MGCRRAPKRNAAPHAPSRVLHPRDGTTWVVVSAPVAAICMPHRAARWHPSLTWADVADRLLVRRADYRLRRAVRPVEPSAQPLHEPRDSPNRDPRWLDWRGLPGVARTGSVTRGLGLERLLAHHRRFPPHVDRVRHRRGQPRGVASPVMPLSKNGCTASKQTWQRAWSEVIGPSTHSPSRPATSSPAEPQDPGC